MAFFRTRNVPTAAGAVAAAFITAGSALYAPTPITPGDVAVSAATIAVGSAPYQPSLAHVVAGPTQPTTLNLYAPTLAHTVQAATLAAGSAPYAPTVTQVASGAFLASSAALYEPSLTLNVSGATLGAASAVYEPTVAPGAVTVQGATLGAGSALYAPSLTHVVAAPTLAVGSALYVPQVVQVAAGATIGTSAAPYAPTVAPGAVTVGGETIAAGAALYPATVDQAVGAQTVGGPTLAAGSALYVPTLSQVAQGATIAAGSAATAPLIERLWAVPWAPHPAYSSAGNTLTRTGADGTGEAVDAGVLLEGDGYIQFRANANSFYYRGVGFSMDVPAIYTQIDYWLAPHNVNPGPEHAIRCIENGIATFVDAHDDYDSTTWFRLELSGTTVRFKRNGVTIYSSPNPATAPLRVYGAIYFQTDQVLDLWASPSTTPRVFVPALAAASAAYAPTTITPDQPVAGATIAAGSTLAVPTLAYAIVGPTIGLETVEWTNAYGVAAEFGGLRKTLVEDPVWDAGARSVQEIPAGVDAYVEFSIADAASIFILGLSHDDPDYGFTTIDFGAYFRGATNQYQFYEDGVIGGSYGGTPIPIGDRWRVSIESGVIKYYYSNGVLAHASWGVPTPQFPLWVDSSFRTTNAKVANVQIYRPVRATLYAPFVQQFTPVILAPNANYTISGSSFSRPGADGSGVVRGAAVLEGDGYLQFLPNEAVGVMGCGLSTEHDVADNPAAIDYALELAFGLNEVRAVENGVTRATAPYFSGELLTIRRTVVAEVQVVQYKRGNTIIRTIASTSAPLYVYGYGLSTGTGCSQIGTIDASPVVFAPTLATGEALYPPSTGIADQVVEAATIATGQALYAPTVIPPPGAVGGATYNAGPTLYAPTVLPGPVTIGTDPIPSPAPALYVPTVVLGPAPQAVGSATLATGAALYAPTITTSYTLTAGTLGPDAALYAPALSQVAAGATIPTAAALYAPTVLPGPVAVDAATIAASSTLAVPELAYRVTGAKRTSAAVLRPPSIATANTVLAATLAAGSALYVPTLAYRVEPSTRASAAALYTPTVELAIRQITTAFIGPVQVTTRYYRGQRLSKSVFWTRRQR